MADQLIEIIGLARFTELLLELPGREVKSLVVYLRSLTPKGQGDFLGPDGKYYPVTKGQGNMSLQDLIAQMFADLLAGKM